MFAEAEPENYTFSRFPPRVFIVLGINHNSAAIELRERVAIAPEQMPEAHRSARALPGVEAVAILSTCNRTELYVESSREVDLVDWLAEWAGVPSDLLTPVHYRHQESVAAGHLIRVASGLDSLVLGEPQILGQLKSSYAVAQQAGTLSPVLNATFQHAFAVAKRVRSETAIGRNPVSVAFASVSLARQIFTTLENKTALLVGAGETISLVARHLREQGLQSMIIANRTHDRAAALAREFGAEAILLSDIPTHLHRADIVVTSTASQLPLLGKGAVESALRQRRHRMMFMVDLAVPRDIETEVSELDDVYLYDVDDLGEVIEENRRAREEAAAEAAVIVTEGVEQWVALARTRDGASWVRRYREQCEQLRDDELDRALAQIARGAPAEEVLARFASDLTNKLIHQPTLGLNEALASGEPLVLARLARLLGLDDDRAEDDRTDDDNGEAS